jgi:hypothetical protein
MLSLISTLGGLLISGLPKLLDFFQDKSDKKHEMELPTSSGAWPLVVKIKEQAELQIPKETSGE